MDFTTVGIWSIMLLLGCLFFGLPIAVDFLLVAILGTTLLIGLSPALSLLGDTLYSSLSNPAAVVIPLFALMGAFGTEGGFAQRAYRAVHIIAARIPASLAVATAIGSAFFGAISGSTMASAVVFGKLAYPEMKRAGYDRPFALGSIASSGTFACMIPPSGMFILFAIFTDLSVGKLFMSGIFPGLLTAGVYVASMIIRAKYKPKLAPIASFEKDVSFRDRAVASKDLWEVMILAVIVIGGIYSGILTPIGAGAIGALGAFLIGFIRGPLRKFSSNRKALRDTGNTAAMLFFMIVTALFFSRFLALTRIPMELAEFLSSWEVHPHVILASIFILWFFLGMVMAQAAVFALTLPILFPVVVELGYNPIWFCVVAMKLNEIAGVSPPVGLSAFALAGATDDGTQVEEIYRGVWPFILCDLIVLVLLFMFPAIATWLPSKL
jgi:C4-dicarboxylate transporter DctM subunit